MTNDDCKTKYTPRDYYKFISNFVPHFNKTENGYEMFSIPTQWIKGSSIEELLNIGIECINKYNGKSPIRYFVEDCVD